MPRLYGHSTSLRKAYDVLVVGFFSPLPLVCAAWEYIHECIPLHALMLSSGKCMQGYAPTSRWLEIWIRHNAAYIGAFERYFEIRLDF